MIVYLTAYDRFTVVCCLLDGLLLIEVDRKLKPGGYFVFHGSSLSTKKGSMASPIEEFVRKICFGRKLFDAQCYSVGYTGRATKVSM